MSDLLSSLFIKDRPWANLSLCSLQKSDCRSLKKKCEWFARNSSESLLKTSNLLEKIHIFRLLFTAFPLFMPKSESLPSLFAPSLFFKEQPWANRSCRSLQKGNRERFAPVTFYKRATGAISSFSTANRSFAHKKKKFAWKPNSEFPTPTLYNSDFFVAPWDAVALLA